MHFNPDGEGIVMETYHTWTQLCDLQRCYSWKIDRFHILNRMDQLKDNHVGHQFTWLKQRFTLLGFHLSIIIPL